MLGSIFSKRKSIDPGPMLRRLMDLTLPNRPVPNDKRIDLRFNRTLPVVVTPWCKGMPITEDSRLGISQDLSDRGLRIIFLCEPTCDQYLITFMLVEDGAPESFHFVTEVRNIKPFTVGAFSVGLFATDLADERTFPAESRTHLNDLMRDMLMVGVRA